jgi:putative addiction module killer protein
MSLLKTIIYKTDSGKEPFSKWLFDLDKITRSIVIARIKRVTLGNFGDCKLLKKANGVWELRIDYGSGFRIYFGRDGYTVVVLLIGGDKGSQERDIDKAQEYWLTYKESKNEK